MTTSLTLTRPQKAAAILVAMGKPAAGRLLKFFKQEELKSLIDAARMLRTIPQADLEKIVAEFEAEFTEGAGLLDSADKMDTLLNETLSPEEVSAIMEGRQKKPDAGPLPVWPQVEKLDAARIGAFLAGEHPQTGALVLSKLSSQLAAQVLLTLEKPLRAEVMKRMVTMASAPQAAARIVENQIRARLLDGSSSKDTSSGQARLASVLNEMDKAQLDEVIQDLESVGTPDLAGVKARVFSFDDMHLLPQKARVLVFDGLSTDVVTLALRGAPEELTEAVLSAIGARARRMIESELSLGSEGIALADIMQARKTVASATVRLSREGAFELPGAQAASEAA
jgi:flagellar motor switch protein FliG